MICVGIDFAKLNHYDAHEAFLVASSRVAPAWRFPERRILGFHKAGLQGHEDRNIHADHNGFHDRDGYLYPQYGKDDAAKHFFSMRFLGHPYEPAVSMQQTTNSNDNFRV